MGLDYACRQFETTATGMVYPNMLGINVTKYNFVNAYHSFARNLLQVCGGIVMTLPQEADLRNEASGQYLRKYLQSVKGVDTEQQMRVLNLIRDLTLKTDLGVIICAHPADRKIPVEGKKDPKIIVGPRIDPNDRITQEIEGLLGDEVLIGRVNELVPGFLGVLADHFVILLFQCDIVLVNVCVELLCSKHLGNFH
jgi:hypothetical protein